MLSEDVLPRLRDAIRSQTRADRRLLDELRADVRPLASQVRTIRPRTTTAVSVVASDGGNNQLEFDPFYVQLVRVVDSYGKELCVDAVSPTTDTDALSAVQVAGLDGGPTALGRLMEDLGLAPPLLSKLSPMIPSTARMLERPDAVPPSWVQVYRDLCEWAALYDAICHTRFATDTLLVRDGLLRSKLFAGELFVEFGRLVEAAIERRWREDRRRIFLVGVAKKSKVLARYYLAMAIEDTFTAGSPCYVAVPRELERKAYLWEEYARGDETVTGEAPKFVRGDMHFVRFGPRSGDPLWIVDVLSSQSAQAPEIFGYLLADAIDGFPVPFYPRSLQRAHEHAQVAGFDLSILQDEVFAAVREVLPGDRPLLLEELRLRTELADRRYE